MRHLSPRRPVASGRPNQLGQVIVIAAMAMVALVGGVSLVVEAGNAYAHQRDAQNAADAVANAGATVLAQRLGGTPKTDAEVASEMATLATTNRLGSHQAWYTDVKGKLLNSAGNVVGSTAAAAQVGAVGTIPPNTQGVQVGGSQQFGTTFARVLGFDTFSASAEATAVTGALTGGMFLPVVFPVNIVDCEVNGDLGASEADWIISDPDPNGGHPIGQEYIVPLCKTGGGSFMILDLDGMLDPPGPMNNCDEEVTNPPSIQFVEFPVLVPSDNGNNCAKELVDEVNALSGRVVLIPICDGECVTDLTGSNAKYHVIRVTAFYLDYMSDQNGGQNAACEGNGTTLVPIRGNGSSSCMAGWFVRYITSGPVGSGTIEGAGAIGVQLIK